jgi:hypothetical protein
MLNVRCQHQQPAAGFKYKHWKSEAARRALSFPLLRARHRNRDAKKHLDTDFSVILRGVAKHVGRHNGIAPGNHLVAPGGWLVRAWKWKGAMQCPKNLSDRGRQEFQAHPSPLRGTPHGPGAAVFSGALGRVGGVLGVAVPPVLDPIGSFYTGRLGAEVLPFTRR